MSIPRDKDGRARRWAEVAGTFIVNSSGVVEDYLSQFVRLLAKAKQDLPRCTPPTCNRVMRQSLLRTIRADCVITISPARKRIGLPIMKVGGIQQLRKLL